MSDRYAVRIGFLDLPPGTTGMRRIARTIAEDMPGIVKMAHDSGNPEVIFHCPFCGSGRVIARSDGTVSCGFCLTAFTVQVQPRYPAFPQTIDGVPMQVPGMGPQWPGQDDEAMQAQQAAQGTDVPDGDPNPFADSGEDDADGTDQEPTDDSGGGNPFAKKSFRTAHGGEVGLDSFLRHVALESARDRRAMLNYLKEGR